MAPAVSTIAAAIVEAPAWALVSLTMPDAQLRECGAEELARWIVGRIDPQPGADQRQLALSL